MPFDNPSLAFLIGAANYKHVPSLETPGQDVKALSKVLKEQYGFQVFPCHNPDKSVLKELFEQEIPHQLNLLGKQADSASVIVYFAGHGIAQDSRSGPQGYLAPIDAQNGVLDSMYDMRSMVLSLDKLPCKHLLLILDCCFGGTARWSSKHRGISIAPDYFSQQHFHHFMQRRSWQVLTSTAPDQPALDFLGHGEEEGHSPFAHYLIKGLQGEADTIQDKVITASELFQYLQNRVTPVTANSGKPQHVGFFPLDNHDHGEFLFVMQDFSPENLPVSATENPYMGLDSYGERQSSLFFGRKKATEEVIKRIVEHPLTVVTGASGSGKSSLVKAGVVPKLKGEKRIITPSRFPLSELEAAKNADILIIDQFEQLITQAEKEDARKFINALPELIRSGKKVVATVRIDFETQLELPEELKRLWDQNRYLVPPFSAEELREIILTPALRAGRFFEPMDLVDTMVTEVVSSPGAMPLLSFTLRQLFQKSLDSNDPYRTISEKEYREMGGIAGILLKDADKVWHLQPDDEHRKTFQNLMLRMVRISKDQISKGRLLEHDMEYQEEAESRRAAVIMDDLIKRRLVYTGRDQHGNIYWEPCHDKLVSSWQKITSWIKDFGLDHLRLLNRLDEAVSHYQNGNKRPRDLWHRNTGLGVMLRLLDRADTIYIPTKGELEFLEKSRKLKKKLWLTGLALFVAVFTTIGVLAMIYFEETKKTDENWVIAEIKKAEGIRNQGNYSKAIKVLEGAMQDSKRHIPENIKADIHTYITSWNKISQLIKQAVSYRKNESYRESLKKWRAAKIRDPGNTWLQDQIAADSTQLEEDFESFKYEGELASGLGNCTAALSSLCKAKRLKPDDPELKALFARCSGINISCPPN